MTTSPDLPGLTVSAADLYRADRERSCQRRAAAQNRGHHTHSKDAHTDLAAVLTGRRAVIHAWLTRHGPATDRQIRDGVMGAAADMNSVRPRVTELIDAHLAVESGAVRDPITGCTVRLVSAGPSP
jgi:hypothetical protein